MAEEETIQTEEMDGMQWLVAVVEALDSLGGEYCTDPKCKLRCHTGNLCMLYENLSRCSEYAIKHVNNA